MRKIISLTLLLGLLGSLAGAQSTVGNYVSGFGQDGNHLFFRYSNADVKLEFCTPGMFRVRVSEDREFDENEHLMVVKYNWSPVDLKIVEEANEFTVKTDELTISIGKNPFTIKVLDANGKVLNNDTKAYVKSDETVEMYKKLFEDEHFFGFGERMDVLDRRGKKVRLNVGRGIGKPHIIGAYNVLEANYSPVPFFMSTRGYGIFLHTSYASEWDMGLSNAKQYSFTAEGGEMDYYFIKGPGFPKILNQYTLLTGRSPMLPKAAFGLHVGTYSGGTWGHESLTSSAYVIALVRKFRELGIPLDILHLDSTWRIFGKVGGNGATTFEWRPTFDNPKAMFDSLYALNIQMAGVHVRPRLDNGNKLKLLDEARKAGIIYPENGKPGEFVNYFDTTAVNWWWNHGAKRLADIGVMFFKTDEGSAFGRKANESNKTGPTGEDIHRLHNLFPIAYAKAPFTKFAEYNNMRGMAHTREGYAGIQRYPFIFAGDWPSEWQYFEPVVKAGLNIGLSGVGYWAHCMGGFEHKADPELYIRWCQFGLLSPVAHLFGMDHPGYKEPWNYGDTALKIFKKYDRLRYQLIPYMYSAAHEMYKTGMPLMRALVLHHQNDPNVYNITDQYLLGSSMMVCPVTTKGAQTRIVYLPEGNWWNYWTGERFEGKQYLNVLTPLDQIPIFIREGAIIPMQQWMNYVGEKPVDQMLLDIYPSENTEFSIYDDDGKSVDYQNGEFAVTKVKSSINDNGITITVENPTGAYELDGREYAFKVHCEKTPLKVSVNENLLTQNPQKMNVFDENEPSGWFFDKEKSLVLIKSDIKGKVDLKIEL